MDGQKEDAKSEFRPTIPTMARCINAKAKPSLNMAWKQASRLESEFWCFGIYKMNKPDRKLNYYIL